MAKIKEYELSMEQMKVEGKRVEGEQKRKYLEEESKQQKYKAEYQVKAMIQIIRTAIIYQIHFIKSLHAHLQFCEFDFQIILGPIGTSQI